MTLEEALGRITDPEVRKFFENMTKNQNSYITQLETQLKELKAADKGGAAVTGNDITQEYIRKKMCEDAVAKAIPVIIGEVGQEIYEAVRPDFEKFLSEKLKPENANEAYIVDAFHLVYGRCFAKKDHPVHQVGKGANPGATPAPQVGTNGQQVAAVQNIIAGQPQVMSGADTSAGQGLPGVQGTTVKNTKDAFARLKDRMTNGGGNRFQ